MRTLRLLLWFCVGLLLGGYSVLSHAARSYPATLINGYCYGSGYPVTTSAIGCASNYGYANCSPTGGANGENKCCKAGSSTNCGMFTTVSVKTCPYGGTLSGSTCINAPDCGAGTIADPITGQCKSAQKCEGDQTLDPATNTCVCAAGQNKYKGYSATVPGDYPSGGVCVNGCKQGTGMGVGIGGSTTTWLGSSTGATCTGNVTVTPPATSNTPGQNTPTSCIEQGQGYVTANGKTTCVTNGPNSPTSTTTTKNEDPDGPNGPTAPTQTEKQVKCEGDTCTTTTTTSGPNGTTTKSESESKISYCEENPNSLLCQNKQDYCEKNPDALGCQKGTLTKGTPGKFEETQGEVTEAKGKWESAIGQIKGEASGLLQVAAGSGSLPNFGSVEVLGKPISMDLARYSDQLQWVVFSLLLMAHVAAVLIALG